MFKYIALFCFLCHFAIAQDYFIHLSESGLNNKSHLLNNQFEKISGINKVVIPGPSAIKIREVLPPKSAGQIFEKWLIIQSSQKTKQIVQSLSDNKLIDFYEPVGHFSIDFESADSLAAEQWYLDKIKVKEAWEITKGSPDIIVCIIDTGIDFRHPDLKQAIWINPAEDLNGNGILDEQDINNIDDDVNGYVDDVVGWDFTDAPRFADGGDYLHEDNQPWDEYGSGHGTQAAGIIAAKDNNVIGIAGIAPQLKIMNLRAGTAAGYLEEDDVGRAILYALENGARIINMSFGDKALSRFLRDVITYAAQQGVVFVASSGNENSNEPHFPSSLQQVISVGASTKNDGIAGFSNYGNSLDIVAPGSEMVSTAIGGGYNSVGGTSFSAPVVSAVAGLLLTQNRELSSDQLRNILKTSSDDIYYQGWDSLSAAGRVSAYNALRVPQSGILKITYPEINSSIAKNEIVLTGSAAHPDLLSTEMSVGQGKFPSNWTTLFSWQGQQVFNDTLAVFQPFAGDTTYTIRLKMQLLNSRIDELRHTFLVDNTAPEISNIQVIDMWDGPLESKLITFETDDICTTLLNVRPLDSEEGFRAVVSPYETVNHRFKIDKSQFDGRFEFIIKAKNRSGLVRIDDNNAAFYSFALEKEIPWSQFNKVPWTLPAGFMYDSVTDFDHDGNKEIVISHYDEKKGFGPIEVYEFNNGQFDLRLLTGFTAIPRAAGDIDRDGKSDLLLGFGQNSFLFEALSPDSFPTQLIWQDTVHFWAADYTDVDNDDILEITGRIENEYFILENSGDNLFQQTGRLTNPTEGENRLGVPKIELLNINNTDGPEIVFGDYDGDLIAYSANGDNSFSLLANGETVHQNAVEIISSDSKQTIFTATHTSENLNYEHEFDARYWSIESFNFDGNMLISTDTINTFGFSNTRDFDSGINHSNFDEKEYLFASFFPNLYIFEKRQNNWDPVWFYNQARSNTILVYDFDNDGHDEFYFNDGENIIGFSSIVNERPSAPFRFIVKPIDSVSVELNWQEVAGAQNYNVYKGINKDNFIFYRSTQNNRIQDTVTIDKKYYYRITSVDSAYTTAESFYSNVDSVITLLPPHYINYEFSGEKQVVIQFDKRLMIDPERPAAIQRSSDRDNASSIIILNNNKLMISFADPFTYGINDSLMLDNIFGETGVPINKMSRLIAVNLSSKTNVPYIKSTGWYSDDEMLVVFSEAMDFVNGPAEFNVIPSGKTKSIKVADTLSLSLLVKFSKDTYIGAVGEPSYLIMEGINSKKGIALDGITRISLFREVNDLKDIKVYPQPVKPKHNALIFANLPGDVQITIYNINGRPVKHLSAETVYGGVSWDLKDNDGNYVASGVYVFNMTWNNKSEQGKIVIVR